nr:myelin transcription factor 1-like protein [Peromyscus maniculatus bairdii]
MANERQSCQDIFYGINSSWSTKYFVTHGDKVYSSTRRGKKNLGDCPTGRSEKPSLHCSGVLLRTGCSHLHSRLFLRFEPRQDSVLTRVLDLDSSLPRCSASPACPKVSDAPVDTSSEITTKDLEEKEVAEEAENGRDAPANGNANEENGEQEADNEVDEEDGEEVEEEEEDEDEEAEASTGKRVAEDDEDVDADAKKQKTDEDD